MPECDKCFELVPDPEFDYDHNVCKKCIADWIEKIDSEVKD